MTTQNPHPDTDCVEQARMGCELSFNLLYQRHAGHLLPMLWRLSGGDGGQAEDWLQECFLKAWRLLDRLDEPAAFGSWLRKLAINLALSDQRRARLATENKTLDIQAAPMPPWPAADRDLEQAITRLPARARQVLVLFCLEGYTHAEIGQLMAIDEGTSKGQLHRARQILKEALS